MICNKCKNQIPDDSKFCAYCGEFFESIKNVATEVSDVDKGYKYLEMKKWKQAKMLFQDSIVNNKNVAEAYIGNLLAKMKLSSLDNLSKKSRNFTKYDDFKFALKYADESYKAKLEAVANNCSGKLKKRNFRLMISGASFVLVSLLVVFVFIPFGRYFWYDDLLSKKEVEKAANSYANSIFFEYNKLNQELFYDCGIEFTDNQEYKNGALCFGKITGYKNSEDYYNYCKAQNLLNNNDLEAYDYFKKCEAFMDSQEILATNNSFAIVDKLQGRWYYPGKSKYEQLKEMRETGKYYEKDEVFYDKSGFNSYQHFLQEINKPIDFSNLDIRFFGLKPVEISSKTIIISGGKRIKINNNSIAISEEGTYKKIEIIDNNTISIEGKQYTKQ